MIDCTPPARQYLLTWRARYFIYFIISIKIIFLLFRGISYNFVYEQTMGGGENGKIVSKFYYKGLAENFTIYHVTDVYEYDFD